MPEYARAAASLQPCSSFLASGRAFYPPATAATILQAKPPAREKLSLFGRQVAMYPSFWPMYGPCSVLAAEFQAPWPGCSSLHRFSRPTLKLLLCNIQGLQPQIGSAQRLLCWWTSLCAVHDVWMSLLQIASETREAIREQERRSGSSKVCCCGASQVDCTS